MNISSMLNSQRIQNQSNKQQNKVGFGIHDGVFPEAAEAAKPVVKLAINGLGRIGMNALRILHPGEGSTRNFDSFTRLMEKQAKSPVKVELTAINIGRKVDEQSLVDTIKNDTVLGPYPGKISAKREEDGTLFLHLGKGDKARKIEIVEHRDMDKFPWKRLNIDVVIDSTGQNKTRESLGKHLEAGSKRVILSAPPEAPLAEQEKILASKDIKQIVHGINDHTIDPKDEADRVLSSASCTTTCVSPMVDLIKGAFGIKQGSIETVHSVTGSQLVLDKIPKVGEKGIKSATRQRSIFNNMIPTSTGVAKAINKVFPELAGKFMADAVRVPVPNGSLSILNVITEKPVTKKALDELFENAAKTEKFRDLVAIGENNFVTGDVVGRHESTVVFPRQTQASGNLAKVYGAYDNEFGYTRSLLDLATKVGTMEKEAELGKKLEHNA